MSKNDAVCEYCMYRTGSQKNYECGVCKNKRLEELKSCPLEFDKEIKSGSISLA